jgi:phospholipid/cholesterol/gamma-HCH transport system substrate-binding protein
MEPEARYTLVGAAVLILVALMVGAFLWLRSTGEGRDARHYKIYFENQSLEGLEVRSDVRMRGIRVGSVSGFRFSSRRPGAVEVLIRVEEATPVRENTRAIVERHLVTGIANVRLDNPTDEGPLLTEAPAGEPYPVISEGESPIQQFSETASQLVARADETMQRINAALSPENRQVFAELLDNLRLLSRDAQGAADEVRKLASSLTSDSRRLSARYDTLGQEASAALREIAGTVGAMREDVTRLAERTDRLMASSEVELRATAQALRSAADSLAATSSRLRDPRQAIFGPAEAELGPGEGRR